VADICREEGVATVAFTKTEACIEALAPRVNRLLISRDNSARWGFNSPAWIANDRTVNAYMRRYPNVFRVGMVVDEQDVQEVAADFYIAHHGKMKHLPFNRQISQSKLVDLVGKHNACTPAHRCLGCPTKCTLDRPSRDGGEPHRGRRKNSFASAGKT
jgi:hypothetical protein